MGQLRRAKSALQDITCLAAAALQMGTAFNAMATARVTQLAFTVLDVNLQRQVQTVSLLPVLSAPPGASTRTAVESVMALALRALSGVPVALTSALAAQAQRMALQQPVALVLSYHTQLDVVEAMLELVKLVQAQPRLVITAVTAQGLLPELPQVVRSAQQGSTCWAAVERTMELALLVPAGAKPMRKTIVWGAAAPILGKTRSVPLAALDITTLVVKGAPTELAWHAPHQQQGITRMVALEPTLESLLHAPPVVAGNSTLTAAGQVLALA